MAASDRSGPFSGGPRPQDQRAARRSSLMLRSAKVVCQSGEYACIIRDVSSDGVGLKFLHPVPEEKRILLELANGDTYPIERVWTGKQQAGFRFASAVSLHDFIHEPSPYVARPVRLRIASPARIVAGHNIYPARLIDLSCGGAMIESAARHPLGSIVRLELPGCLVRAGDVCWADGGNHGLTFHEALSINALAHAALALQPYGSQRIDPASIVIEPISEPAPTAPASGAQAA